MRAIAVGLLAGSWLTWFLSGISTDSPKVYAQRFGGRDQVASEADDVIAIAGQAVEGQQLLLLFDRQRRTLGSYQIDARTGQIALRSVRNVRWDLEMDEFNGTEPSSANIQALLRSR